MAPKKTITPKKLAKDTAVPKNEATPKQIVPSTAMVKTEATPNFAVVSVMSKESNLKKLAETPIIADFVKRTHCEWNHQDWLDLLAKIRAKGFDPIDTDQVGLLLEERRAQILAAKND